MRKAAGGDPAIPGGEGGPQPVQHDYRTIQNAEKVAGSTSAGRLGGRKPRAPGGGDGEAGHLPWVVEPGREPKAGAGGRLASQEGIRQWMREKAST